MGKKKKGGWEEGPAGDYLGVSTKSKLAKKYGVKGATGGGRALEMKGLSGSDYRSDDDVKRDIAKEMANDYDVRRSLEAAGLAGDKKAAKLSRKGISKYGQVEKAWDHLTALKKEHVGGGGMFGAENAASLTDAMVNWDRDELNKSIDERIAANTPEAVPEEDPDKGFTDPKNLEVSPELSEAKERASRFEAGMSVYGGDDEQDSAAVTPASTEPGKADSMLDAFKQKLKEDRNFKHSF